MTVTIYILCDPSTDEVRYVGKTIDEAGRFRSHISDSHSEGRTKNHKDACIRSLDKIGLRPKMEVLERIENSDDTDWQHVERFWISYLRFLGCRLTNLDSGGRNGTRRSPETIEKCRLGNIGKVVSLETRWRIGRVNRGKKLSHPPDRGAHISAAKKGKKFTEAHKMALRWAQMGKKRTPEHIANAAAAWKAVRAAKFAEKSKEQQEAEQPALIDFGKLNKRPKPKRARQRAGIHDNSAHDHDDNSGSDCQSLR